MTDLRTLLIRDCAAELGQPLADLVVAARSYYLSCTFSKARSEVDWGTCMSTGCRIKHIIDSFGPLGVTLEVFVSPIHEPVTFALVSSACNLFGLAGTGAMDEEIDRQMDVFRRAVLESGRG